MCQDRILRFLQEVLGMYCHHILADYITLAATPIGLTGQQRADMGTTGQQHTAHLLPGAAAALKQGACALYGACVPAQVRTNLSACHSRLTCS